MTEAMEKNNALIEAEQLKLAGMIRQDEQLALVALNSFITAYELLRPAPCGCGARPQTKPQSCGRPARWAK